MATVKGTAQVSEAEAQGQFELRITADSVQSTDERFTMDNLDLGDYYKSESAYFKTAGGEIIRRNRDRGEWKSSNQTLPKLACQLFEDQIAALSEEERLSFPICRYRPDRKTICGIYKNETDFWQSWRSNSLEYLTYNCTNGNQFVFYCWNVFSTIIFVQECLKRFGNPGDQFVLGYSEKSETEKNTAEEVSADAASVLSQPSVQPPANYKIEYSRMLLDSKNLIFRGAPGTGKTYLAKQIAADIISNGAVQEYSKLSDEQKKQVEFVQFHPSYDYTDFVEGLRPCPNADGTMGFELQDGIFKKFVARARKNYVDPQKNAKDLEKEISAREAVDAFLSEVDLEKNKFELTRGNEFYITDIDENTIYVYVPNNNKTNTQTLKLRIDKLCAMLSADDTFEKVNDVSVFFKTKRLQQHHSYYYALYQKIRERMVKGTRRSVKAEQCKNYIFIIDEINRGEISKIFGELFFAIDPGYRGKSGEVSTQYASLHDDPDEKFYIPENVYIIGTMNDIDRSVDSFDFAMRRRFRFVELRADTHLEMLSLLENEDLRAEAIRRMTALNQKIAKTPELNENYQIGAAYFLKLKTLTFDQLWEDCLQPLLEEYVQGARDEKEYLQQYAEAYGYLKPAQGDVNEAAENQG